MNLNVHYFFLTCYNLHGSWLNMLILSICDSEFFVTIMNAVRIVIRLITIAVPIILIVSLMIDITKELSSGSSDMIGKIGKVAVAKIIAAILIFFIPNFVILIARLANKEDAFIRCVNLKVMKSVKVDKSTSGEGLTSAFNRLETTYSTSDYNRAYSYVSSMEDSELKRQYLDRLARDLEIVKASNLVTTAEKSGTYEAYYEALTAVNALGESNIKNILLQRLSKVKNSLDTINKYNTNN